MISKKFFILMAVLLFVVNTYGSVMSEDREYINSIGMKFVRIQPGTFHMGQAEPAALEVVPSTGDFDEKPVHRVNITKGFYVGATEVTNAQYEPFVASLVSVLTTMRLLYLLAGMMRLGSVSGLARRRGVRIACLPRPNGNMRAGQGHRRFIIPGPNFRMFITGTRS